jgi:hypothetical protein
MINPREPAILEDSSDNILSAIRLGHPKEASDECTCHSRRDHVSQSSGEPIGGVLNIS